MNKIIIGVLVLVILGGGVVFYLSQSDIGFNNSDTHEDEHMHDDSHEHEEEVTSEVPVDEGVEEMIVNEDGEEEVLGDATVIYTDDGFRPKTVEISVGSTITFLNESSRKTWPASAQHPTHTVYPGSSIGKCNTQEASIIFDACHGVAPGENWVFTFNEVGTWNYHDHLRANQFGTVIVVE